jgi:hypothetical protein
MSFDTAIAAVWMPPGRGWYFIRFAVMTFSCVETLVTVGMTVIAKVDRRLAALRAPGCDRRHETVVLGGGAHTGGFEVWQP